jgi:hypothetical protein
MIFDQLGGCWISRKSREARREMSAKERQFFSMYGRPETPGKVFPATLACFRGGRGAAGQLLYFKA